MNKKERLVAAIEQGTVIDHIPAAKTYQVANLLGLFAREAIFCDVLGISLDEVKKDKTIIP
jgi:aspartate carbamoyltransferase regulatory subunit